MPVGWYFPHYNLYPFFSESAILLFAKFPVPEAILLPLWLKRTDSAVKRLADKKVSFPVFGSGRDD